MQVISISFRSLTNVSDRAETAGLKTQASETEELWSGVMSKGEQETYRARAISADVQAQNEADPELRGILEGMAMSYRALVREADQVAHIQRSDP